MTTSPSPAARPGSPFGSALASLLLVIAPIGAVVAALGLRDRLPDPLPRHWNFAGEVDGTTGLVAFSSMAIGAAAALAVLGLVMLWAIKDRQVAGFSVALAGWLVWFLSVLYIGTLVASVDAGRAEDVALPGVAIVVALGLSVLVAWGMSRLVPAVRTEAHDVERGSSLTLSENEVVVWIGTASSRGSMWIGTALALVGAVVAVLVDSGGFVCLAVGLFLAYLSSLTVRIDADGVHVVWGPLGRLGTRTALDEIESVTTTVARPGEWGGWGYRMSGRGSAHLVRGGEALVLRRRGRKDLLITVDGAEQGRDVLAALLARRGAEA